ncbi:unnamed protein product [Mortierella alpina]
MMLSHSNLARLARLHQKHEFSRDLVQEYLDSLLSVEAFEPLKENKVETVTDSNTAVTKPKPRPRQSKKAKGQTAPPSDKSRPSENSKPSSTRRRRGPSHPRQHKYDALNYHAVQAEFDETGPTSETTNGEVVTKRLPKLKTKRATEQSEVVEHKAQELDGADVGLTQTRNKSRNGRKVKQRSRCKKHAQGQGQGPGQGQEQGQEQGVMTEQLQNEPRSSRNFEVHAQSDKTEGTLLSPRKNAEERVIDQNAHPAPTVARTGYRNWHKKPNGRKRRGEASRGGKGKSCSLEAGSVSMRQIANEVGRVHGL